MQKKTCSGVCIRDLYHEGEWDNTVVVGRDIWDNDTVWETYEFDRQKLSRSYLCDYHIPTLLVIDFNRRCYERRVGLNSN